MATDIRQLPATSDRGHEGGMFARAAGQIRQFICGLHGHDALLHFERGRISLLCSTCGHETPGWDVKGSTARREQSPGARVVPMRLRERRIA